MVNRPKPIKAFKRLMNRKNAAINEVVREPTAGGVVFRRAEVGGGIEIFLSSWAQGFAAYDNES